MPWDRRIFRKQGKRKIEGTYLQAFIHNGAYFLVDIGIYQDAKIDCWELVDFATFKRKVRSGWVCTQLPPGADVSISFLACFRPTQASYWIDPEEFIKEVHDEIEELNGRPTTADRCRLAFEHYLNKPGVRAKAALKKAYEAIPEHNRRYVLGDQDRKDGAIRDILESSDRE